MNDANEVEPSVCACVCRTSQCIIIFMTYHVFDAKKSRQNKSSLLATP